MRRISSLMLISFAALAGCERTRETVEGTRETPMRAPELGEDKQREEGIRGAKEDYKGRVDAVLSDLDKQMTALEGKKTGQNKSVIEEQITNLKKRKDVLENDKKLIEKATAETWPTIREQVDKDIRDTRALFTTPGKT